MEIKIVKDSDIPIYKQILSQMLDAVKKGQLVTGEKLPSERFLSKELNVSRGTITKAYNELANMEVVTLIKGKGCYVSDAKEFISLSRKDKAVSMIKNSINNLLDLGFSLSEIRIFSEIVLMEQEKNYSAIKIGIIDCNREALHAIHCQIGTIKEISISKFLLDEINDKHIQYEIENQDLLITTYTHYDQVLKVLPEIEDRLIRVAMTPSKKTLVELGRVSKEQKLGVLYDSDTFIGVIRKGLKVADLGVDDQLALKLDMNKKEEIIAFVKNKEVVIIPPITFFDTAFRRFLMLHLSGKSVIEFDYLMERGNLLYLEEKIRRLMVTR